MLLFNIIFIFLDLIAITFAFIFAWFIRFNIYQQISFSDSFNNSINNFPLLLYLTLAGWFIINISLRLYHVPRTRRRIKTSFWSYFCYPQLILILLIFIIIIFMNYDQIPRLFLIYFIFIEFLLLLFIKKVKILLFKFLRISGLDLVNLGLISNQKDIEKCENWLSKNSNLGFKLKVEKNVHHLVEKLKQGDNLLINKKYLSDKKILIKIEEIAENKGIHVYYLISPKKYYRFKNKNLKSLNKLGSLYLIKKRKILIRHEINIINKRIFDIIFSFFFIILIYWWVHLILSILIKIQSSGPIIFKQKRVGLDGEIFTCYKFRTMHIDLSNSKKLTILNDPRVFPLGQFLRRTNIDEFPQFINVLIGNMSVVGPRPHMMTEDKKLENTIIKYRMRRWAKPGITGYAAMNGYRGGTESLDLMQKRINLDVRYIEKWSFFLDIKICLKTAMEMLFGNSKGH